MIPNDQAAFVNQVIGMRGVPAMRMMADEVLAQKDVTKQRIHLVTGNHLNPFFVPNPNDQPPALNAFQLVYMVSQARMAAANTQSMRVIVSAPMKSGSTFISDSLCQALGVQKISLMMLLARPYDYPVYGAATRPHEIDELALLTACLQPKGFVAHHHMLATPFLAKQAELYNLKFVLLRRNIFDCIVSLDDFLAKRLRSMHGDVGDYIETQLPLGWLEFDAEERVHHLLNRFLHRYVHYHVSWKLLEREGLVSPLWISYEDEILVDKVKMASRIGDWLDCSPAVVDRLAAQFGREKGLEAVHFNKGIAGRGRAIQGANRKRVIAAFNDFKDLADWSEILD
jgi:hypothetical protein